jgi:hypothetical protein
VYSLAATGMTTDAVAGSLGWTQSDVVAAVSLARSRRPTMERREDRVAWELHRAVVDHLRAERGRVLALAARNIARLRETRRSPLAEGWVDEWEALLAGPDGPLVERMLGTDERSVDMRQIGPFAGVLTQDERLIAIRKASWR